MRKLLWITVFCLFGAVLFAQQNLSWTMAVIRGSQGVSFSQPVEMRTGESFNIIIRARQDCFIYLVAQDSERQMIVIANRRLRAGEDFQTGFIGLTPPSGSEQIYVIVSRTEQTGLQDAITAFIRQNNARTGRDLFNAVMEIRRSLSAFNEEPERPVTMAGAFRGTNISATEYSGAPVYVKSIIINH